MKGKPVLYKSLVVGVIVLFIGMGIQPAVAVDNPIPISEEVYENSNCFVIGRSSETIRIPAVLWGLLYGKGNFSKFICFGTSYSRDGGSDPSEGWIYTKGDMGEWTYKGEFYGDLGVIGFTSVEAKYIGINSFQGLAVGGLILPLILFDTFYIGYAKEVRITTQTPV